MRKVISLQWCRLNISNHNISVQNEIVKCSLQTFIDFPFYSFRITWKIISSAIENKSNGIKFFCVSQRTRKNDLLCRPWNNRSESSIMSDIGLCGKIHWLRWARLLQLHLFLSQRLSEWQWQVESSPFNQTFVIQCPACFCFHLSGEIDKLYILATVLGLLSIFSVLLFIGVINQNRMFIAPWLWLKYALVTLQVIRFIAVIIELAANDKNTVGASPIFELLFLGEINFHLRFEFPRKFALLLFQATMFLHSA